MMARPIVLCLRSIFPTRSGFYSPRKTRTCKIGETTRRFPLLLCLAFLSAVGSWAVFECHSRHPPSVPASPKHEFLPSSRGRPPRWPSFAVRAAAPERIQVAMIFDEHRLNFSLSVMRSLMHYAKSGVTLHLITPVSLHSRLHQLETALPGDAAIIPHDYRKCAAPVSLISFIARHIHPSAMCKVFLAEIVPAERVLYIDSDVTVVADIMHCWAASTRGPSLAGSALLAMGVDMGEACQAHPDRCYPIGMSARIARGLQCGTTSSRARIVRADGHLCQNSGDLEPYQFNGGVVLMELRRMRARAFTARFVQASVYAWRMTGHRQAEWGEQDLLNSFFRMYPAAIANLPCGCNFQYSAARRESKCPGRAVVIAHGWTRQLLDSSSHDQFNLHFNFFRRTDVDFRARLVRPPKVKPLSRTAPDWMPPYIHVRHTRGASLPVAVPDPSVRIHDPSCAHQAHHCTVRDRFRAERIPLHLSADNVYVLTSSTGQGRLSAETMASIRAQSHPRVHHALFTAPLGADDALQTLRSLRCSECESRPALSRVIGDLPAHVRNGWVLHLRDGHVFENNFVISDFLAMVNSRNDLLSIGSNADDIVSFDHRLATGRISSKNIVFHTDNTLVEPWSRVPVIKVLNITRAIPPDGNKQSLGEPDLVRSTSNSTLLGVNKN